MALRPLSEDRARMLDAARRAGEAALRRWQADDARAWAKADDSPVSEADLEANDILREGLVETGDGYGWLSEETEDDEDRLSARRTWIVDPIDGTRAFLAGKPHFAVCVALVEDGRALLSVIHAPATGETWEAAAGGGARLNGETARASGRAELGDCAMLGSRRMFDHPGWPDPWPAMRLGYRNSTSYRMGLVGSGAFDATLALTPKADWDVAPGALIAAEAGAVATDHLGEPFVFARAEPRQRALVCAAPDLHPKLMVRLAHLPADLTKLSV